MSEDIFGGSFGLCASRNLPFHSRVNVSLPFSDGGQRYVTPEVGGVATRDKSRAPEQPVPGPSERTSRRLR